MNNRFHIDTFDHEDGMKTYNVVDGGQSVCKVPEDLFDNPWDAKKWAAKIRDALNKEASK